MSTLVLFLVLVFVTGLFVGERMANPTIKREDNPCVVVPDWTEPNSGDVRVGQYCDKGYGEA